MENLQPNEGKSLTIEVDGEVYCRFPIKTHVITEHDKIADVVSRYAGGHVKSGDILFMSEKAVACSQKRAVPLSEIHPRPLAKFLCKFVYKSPYGIGLGIPETMEMALRECGTLRILFAALVSAVGKLFNRRGWFYKLAGYKAESIDGPTPYTLPPYNKCVVLGPLNPDGTAREVSKAVGAPFLIVDVNDLAGKILGASDDSIDRDKMARILKDNPLGQSAQQTPLGIIRRAPDAPGEQDGTLRGEDASTEETGPFGESRETAGTDLNVSESGVGETPAAGPEEKEDGEGEKDAKAPAAGYDREEVSGNPEE